jgi:hypothetical protein
MTNYNNSSGKNSLGKNSLGKTSSDKISPDKISPNKISLGYDSPSYHDSMMRDVGSKKEPKFRLIKQEEDFIYKPDERQFSFYQICFFPVSKKRKVRKIIYNENGDIMRNTEALLKKDKLDKFLKKCPKYKYTIYPTYDLDVVGFPSSLEILTAKSQILNEY